MTQLTPSRPTPVTNDTAQVTAYPRRSATIHLAFRGAAVDLVLNDTPIEQIEKAIDGLLGREGWSISPMGENSPMRPAQQPQNRRNGPKRPQLLPTFDADGDPLCPWHAKPLRSGKYGKYCPTSCDDEHANDRGYCTFTWRD